MQTMPLVAPATAVPETPDLLAAALAGDPSTLTLARAMCGGVLVVR